MVFSGRSRILFDGSKHYGKYPYKQLDDDASDEAEQGLMGAIGDLGVMDYMVVRQKLLRYEMGEVSHIENVLRGEYRERLHRRSRRIEESFTVENERNEESERDLQSTERFELKNETSETIKSDQKLEAGINATYKGPCIEVSANAICWQLGK